MSERERAPEERRPRPDAAGARRERYEVRALCIMALLAIAAPAAAEPPRPRAPRVIDVPTAWVQPRDVGWGTAGADHRGGLVLLLTGSLAGLAEAELGHDDAAVKLGGARGRLAIAAGLRRSFRGLDRATAFAVASAELGPVRLHAGAAVLDATDLPGVSVRPGAAVEWTPDIYPRTTLLAELRWATDDAMVPEVGWRGGWGVRYQALDWGSIELTVRHQQGDDLSGSTVMVRVNGSTNLRDL